MSIVLTNSWAAITTCFAQIERQAKKTEHEICGPLAVLGGVGLFLLFVFLVPA